MIYDTFESPIGILTVSTDGSKITSLHIEGSRYFTAIPDDWTRDKSQPILQQTKKQLEEYFNGTRKNFDLPLEAAGTSFQKSVWDALAEIPIGTTTSYGAIAKKIGKDKAVRAVGSAIGHNPLCIVVPCHRVLGSDGSLSGFAAGTERKKKLLVLEGIAA